MKKTAFTFFCLLSTLAFSNGQTGIKQIDYIHQRECHSDKGFEIVFTTPHLNPDNCPNNLAVNLSCNAVNFNTMSSIALTALVAGKDVWMWLDGCDSEGQAQIKSIRINR